CPARDGARRRRPVRVRDRQRDERRPAPRPVRPPGLPPRDRRERHAARRRSDAAAGVTARAARTLALMVRRVATLFKPYRLQVGFVGLTIVLTSGIGVANPILSKYVIDSALFPHVHLGLLYTLVGLMVGI